jgi:hypothetical protein
MTRGGATPPICWVGCGALGYRLEDLREAEWDAGLGNGGVWLTIRQYAEEIWRIEPVPVEPCRRRPVPLSNSRTWAATRVGTMTDCTVRQALASTRLLPKAPAAT